MNPRTYRTILFKISPDNIPGTIDFLTKKWREFDPNRALDYTFLDATFDQQYRAEQRLSEIFTYFTAFSIFIACLGLYGMSSYTAEQRTKEIGIRKVLGATIPGILLRISREYIGTILVSFIVAIPIAYFAMNRWLQDFAFRIEIRPGVFLAAGALSLLIAVLTVSYQSVRAALKNPVQTLRYDES
jgi:putative ABC transport system permease protein